MQATDGSSPRARGTPQRGVDLLEADRFIPASAGNTSAKGIGDALSAVHPREHGKHGVPSRARFLTARFIPASAGNTSRSRRRQSPRPVHPRERGEHAGVDDFEIIHVGSSPRARGTLFR